MSRCTDADAVQSQSAVVYIRLPGPAPIFSQVFTSTTANFCIPATSQTDNNLRQAMLSRAEDPVDIINLFDNYFSGMVCCAD